VAEGAGVKGWAPAANVILFDQAIDYITNQIRANPGFSSNYLWRANVWSERKEHDIGIADYNEAIRLDPGMSRSRLLKALIRLTIGHEDVVADARSAIETDAWKGTDSLYAAIVGHLGARRVKNKDAAREFLDDADHKADKSLWP
jgi:tetratricopeptide (TPR) repeat protein